MAKQTRLTQEQVDKFYAEYKIQKEKKFAGDLLDKKIWKSEMELYLNQENINSVNWTNTDIRKANRMFLRSGSWTDKQIAALQRNFTNDADAVAAFVAETGVRPQDIPKVIRNESGIVYSFLINYSANWNEYFNS